MADFLPYNLRPSTAMDSITSGMTNGANAIVEAQKIKRDRDQRALENLRNANEDKRQRQVDFQNALVLADKLKKSGDVEGARAVLAPFADSPNEGQIQTRELQAPKPWQANMNTGEYNNALLDQVGDAVAQFGGPTGPAPSDGPSPSPAIGPGTPLEPPPQMQGMQGAGPPPPSPDQANLGKLAAGASPFTVFGGEGPQAGPQAPTGQPAPMPGATQGANPLVAAAQNDQAQKARLAKFFTGRFNGQQLTFDPEAEQADRLARADKAFAETGADDGETGSLVRELYPQMRAAAIAAGEPIDTKETLKYIQGEVKGRRSEAAQAAREAQFDRTFGQRADLTHDRLDQSDINSKRAAQARVTAAGLMAQPEVKKDARNTADTANLGAAVHKYFQDFDAKTLLKSDRLLNAAITNVAAEGPDAVMSHKDAFFGLERYFRGGIPTDSETQLLVRHMGGIPGAVKQFLADVETGDFSSVTLQNIAAAATRAKAENEANKARFVEGAAKRFGPNSEFRLMGPNVNTYWDSMNSNFGLDLPPLYAPGTGGEGATLGSGERPNVGKAKRRNPAPGSKPGTVLPTRDYVKMFQEQGEAK